MYDTMKEYKVDSNDAPLGFIAVEAKHILDCNGCEFGTDGFLCNRPNEYNCSSSYRDDKNDVVFIKEQK